jgi:hypothetical protein
MSSINVVHYTKIDNIHTMASKINCNYDHLCKFLSKKLHYKIDDGCIIGEFISQSELENIIKEFVKRYLVCPSCREPSIDTTQNKCRSCDYERDKRKTSLDTIFETKQPVTDKELFDQEVSVLIKDVYDRLSRCKIGCKQRILENILTKLWNTETKEQFEKCKRELLELTP